MTQAIHEQQKAVIEESKLSLAERNPASFYERLFYYALRKAPRGTLRLVFPASAEQRIIGEVGKLSAEIIIEDEAVFKQTILYGEIGFGEAYVFGWWRTTNLNRVLDWFMLNSAEMPTFSGASFTAIFVNVLSGVNKVKHLLRSNSLKMARRNISDHYDLSNDFFKLWLDESMTYSSALFSPADDLHTAQLNKYERICQKLQLKPEDEVLEIGCGWGGFAEYAASRYGCRIRGVTISQEQYDFATQRIRKAGLDHLVTFELRDYRLIEGQYDKIASIEMVEALGFEFWDTFFGQAAKLLKQDGIMVIQCITFPDPHFAGYLKNVDFIQKHIFPGSVLLSPKEITQSLDRASDLMIWDIESIGLHYATTLAEWRKRVHEKTVQIKELGFDDEFLRKWEYYLVYCETGFKHRYINAMQLVLSRPLNGKLANYHGEYHYELEAIAP